jgi:hypothetical protein
LNEGWAEGDIEAAFTQIRHEAFLQIPIYAKVHNWLKSADQKTAELPTRTLIQIFIAIGLLFIGGVFILYYFLDPLGIRSAERDKTREEAAIELRLALEKFHKENNATYPAKLNQLVPKYLSAVPTDPRSKTPYSYKALSNNAHYEFCIDFEAQIVRCISSDNDSAIPDAPETEAVPAPVVLQYAVNGQVYFDLNKNGVKDGEEETPKDLHIKISDATNAVICDTLTDTSGIFNCNVIGQGQYVVSITPPVGYTSDIGSPILVALPSTSSTQPNVETLFIGLVK